MKDEGKSPGMLSAWFDVANTKPEVSGLKEPITRLKASRRRALRSAMQMSGVSPGWKRMVMRASARANIGVVGNGKATEVEASGGSS